MSQLFPLSAELSKNPYLIFSSYLPGYMIPVKYSSVLLSNVIFTSAGHLLCLPYQEGGTLNVTAASIKFRTKPHFYLHV